MKTNTNTVLYLGQAHEFEAGLHCFGVKRLCSYNQNPNVVGLVMINSKILSLFLMYTKHSAFSIAFYTFKKFNNQIYAQIFK